MLDFSTLNIWAILVATIINCVVGAFWYSPGAFAKQWEKHTGVDILKIPPKDANRIISFVALSAALQAFTLAVILRSLDVTSAAQGLAIGLFLWLGLVTATTVGVTLYSRRSWKFLWLNASYFLVVMAVNAILLSIWR